ncbi:MAG: CBS domain-containing protein [Chromatiaceae bacterium]|jgi:CBS domain-containing protein|nr:CBS domain-containing protein [Chromatiaceae bacterium]
MKVSALLDRKGRTVHTTQDQTSAADAAKMLVERRIGALLVVNDQGRAVGILSERDIVTGIATEGADLTKVTVGSLMTTDVVTCAPDDSVVQLMGKMTERRVRHLPVYDGDELLGIVSIGDAVKNRIEEIEAEATALREYLVPS